MTVESQTSSPVPQTVKPAERSGVEQPNYGPGDPEFWETRWQTGSTGWDQGGAHPFLDLAFAELQHATCLIPHANVLEPGCGRAHNGAELARRGLRVTSFDASPTAVDAAREAYGQVSGLTLAVADALTPQDAWRGRFDVVFDRAMLCALPPEKRRAYLDAAWEHLTPGGHFVSILFTEVVHPDGKSGPPFQVTVRDLMQLCTARFTLLSATERATSAISDRVRGEAVVVLQRRDRPLIEATP